MLPYAYSYNTYPVPERVVVCIFFTSGHSDAQFWMSECPDVKNWFNPVWHRMLYSCTYMETVGVRGLNISETVRDRGFVPKDHQ